MHLYPLCILYTDWQFGNTLNGTFVNKYAWDSICKYSTFQLVSFLLFLLFLSQNAWFFFFKVNLLFCNPLFEKWKSLSIQKLALWNLRGSGTSLLPRPSFPLIYRSVKKLGGLLLISSHLWSSQSLIFSIFCL